MVIMSFSINITNGICCIEMEDGKRVRELLNNSSF